MDASTLAKALQLLRPGCAYIVYGPERLKGETEARLVWNDTSVAQPTDAELQAALLTVLDLSYQDQRLKEYPSINDQLDAIWKGGQAQTDMAAKIQAVKAKYPKPS